VALGPAEIHPQEHLGPVGRLRAARARTDRQEGAALVVLARKEELRPLAAEIALECGGLPVELGRELGIAGLLDKLERRQEILGATNQAAPQLDLRTQAVRLAQDPLGRSLVVPEAGRARIGFELGEPALPGV
jgi:hypothetical protein